MIICGYNGAEKWVASTGACGKLLRSWKVGSGWQKRKELRGLLFASVPWEKDGSMLGVNAPFLHHFISNEKEPFD